MMILWKENCTQAKAFHRGKELMGGGHLGWNGSWLYKNLHMTISNTRSWRPQAWRKRYSVKVLSVFLAPKVTFIWYINLMSSLGLSSFKRIDIIIILTVYPVNTKYKSLPSVKANLQPNLGNPRENPWDSIRFVLSSFCGRSRCIISTKWPV